MFSCEGNEIPLDVLVGRILPLLDRVSFDRLGVTNKSFYWLSRQGNLILPPWPDRLVAKDHMCLMKSLAFSVDGRKIACGCSDGRVRLWNLRSGEESPLEGHWPNEAVTCLVFGNCLEGEDSMRTATSKTSMKRRRRNSLRLASAATDHTIQVWDLGPLSTNQPKRRRPFRQIHSAFVSCMQFSSDDEVLVVGHHNTETIKAWNLQDGSLIRSLTGPLSRVTSLEVSSNGMQLVSTACGEELSTQCLRVWDFSEAPASATPFTRCLQTGVPNLVVSKIDEEGRFSVASANLRRGVGLWKMETSTALACPYHPEFTNATKISLLRQKSQGVKGHIPRQIVFSSDGRFIACLTGFQSIQVWEVRTGALQAMFDDGLADSFYVIAFCPANQHHSDRPTAVRMGAISSRQNQVRIFSSLSGE